MGLRKRSPPFAEQIANEDVRSLVINMEHEAFDQGLAQELADHLNGPPATPWMTCAVKPFTGLYKKRSHKAARCFFWCKTPDQRA
jgi:hypothetical protein